MIYRLAFASLILFSASSAVYADYLSVRESRPLLGTMVSVEVCYVDGRQDDVRAGLDEAWRKIEEIQKRLNEDVPQSDVFALNAARGFYVPAGEDLQKLLKLAREYHSLTAGAFDVTVRPVFDAWAKAAGSGQTPLLDELKEARSHIGMDKIVFKDNLVGLTDPLARVDLRGLVDAHAADEVKRILKGWSFHNFFVEVSGQIYAAGTSCAGKPWQVGVQDPQNPHSLLDKIELTDAAVSTRGDLAQVFTIGSDRWSKIVNPFTAYPVRGVANATVVAPSASQAFALSTAVCVRGPSEGIKMIKELGDGYDAAVVFRRDNDQYEWYATPDYGYRRVAE